MPVLADLTAMTRSNVFNVLVGLGGTPVSFGLTSG